MSRDSNPSPGRADILQAALREFADHGFPGATTAAIARRAGVTQPLVHHHFGSKQGLWEAVVASLFQDLEDALAAALREVEGADRRTRLAHLLRTLVRFSGRRPELSRLIRAESSAGGAPFDTLYTRWLSRMTDLFRRELMGGMEDGTLRRVELGLAYFVIVGASTDPFAEPETARRAFGLEMRDEATVERYADFVVDVVFRGLLSPSESA